LISSRRATTELSVVSAADEIHSTKAGPAMPDVAYAGPQSQPKSEPALRRNGRCDGSAQTLKLRVAGTSYGYAAAYRRVIQSISDRVWVS
jgi:hypothetical protein